ncbi:MAG TPA: LLM class F420-dependent oxidoreductase [candidate division Zixibacteria bacterium]|nr:LLM class F420-dependent oxidoreductase [candidate division Zixibacteria bacterium]
MQFGIALPHFGSEASREAIVEAAQAAELLGFDSVWVLDRLLWPLEPISRYPGNPRGALPVPMQNTYDPMSVLAFVASCTRRVRLGTSVLVTAYRSPVLLAKMAATVDQLSGGRLILGLGAGWSADEFNAVGEPLAERRRRADEYIRVLDTLWTQDEPSFEGEFYRVPKSIFLPKPAQKPRPPIWIGGNSAGALRRAARFGDGWHPTNRIGVAGLEQALRSLREWAGKRGQDVKVPALSLRWNALPDLADPADREDLVSRLRQYSEAGVEHVCFDLNIPASRPMRAMIEAMTRLAWEVAPGVRR